MKSTKPKKPNFISALSLKQQQERIRWFVGTSILFVFVVIGISIMQVLQVRRLLYAKRAYTKATQQAQPFNTLVQQEKKLKDTIAQLSDSLAQLSKSKEANKTFAQALKTSTSLVPASAINSFEFQNNQIRLTLTLSHMRDIQQYIKALHQEIPFDSIQVSTITYDANTHQYTATVTLTLKI